MFSHLTPWFMADPVGSAVAGPWEPPPQVNVGNGTLKAAGFPVQIEFDKSETAQDCFSATHGFTAETLPPVSRVTVLYMGDRDGVTGGAA